MSETLYDKVIDQLNTQLGNDNSLRIERETDNVLVEVIERHAGRISEELGVGVEFERMVDFATAKRHLHAIVLTRKVVYR